MLETGGEADKAREPNARLPIWPALLATFLQALSTSTMVPNASPIAMSAPFSLGVPVECTWQNCTNTTTLDIEDVKVRSQTVLSITQSTSAAFELVSAGVLGALCDRIGTKPVALISQVGHLVMVGTTALCSEPSGQLNIHVYHIWRALLVSHALSGLCGQVKTPVQAYVARAKGGSVRDFGKLQAVLGLAFCAGPLINITATWYNSGPVARFPLFVATCVSFLGLMITALAWPMDGGLRKELDLESSLPCLLVWRVLCAMPLGLYGSLNFVDGFGKDMMHSGLMTFTNKVFGWGPARFSGFLLVGGLLSPLVLFCLLPRLLRCFGRVFVLRLGSVAMLVSLLGLFALGLTPWGQLLYLVPVAISITSMVSPAMMGLALQELSKEEVGMFSGALAVTETLAKITAPLLTGAIMTRTLGGPVPSAVFLVSGAVVVPGVVLAWCIRPRDDADGSGSDSDSSSDTSQEDLDVDEE